MVSIKRLRATCSEIRCLQVFGSGGASLSAQRILALVGWARESRRDQRERCCMAPAFEISTKYGQSSSPVRQKCMEDETHVLIFLPSKRYSRPARHSCGSAMRPPRRHFVITQACSAPCCCGRRSRCISDTHFRGHDALQKVALFIRAFVKFGCQQLQLNTLNVETLRGSHRLRNFTATSSSAFGTGAVISAN